jgi:tricarballylate dehydrogenase
LKVAVLERATIEDRGGNTRWTEALMRMKSETEVADDLEDHFMANSGFHLDPSLIQEAGDSHEDRSAIVRSLGVTDPELISTLSSEAGHALTWLKKFGITYSDMPTYLITQSTTRLMPVGGGWALVEALVKAGENLGVKFFYETPGMIYAWFLFYFGALLLVFMAVYASKTKINFRGYETK